MWDTCNTTYYLVAITIVTAFSSLIIETHKKSKSLLHENRGPNITLHSGSPHIHTQIMATSHSLIATLMIKNSSSLSLCCKQQKLPLSTNIPGHNIIYSATSSFVPRLSPPPAHMSLGMRVCYFK